MKIFAIESSCDETAAAVVETKGGRFNILANTIVSQIDIHRQYGGVVPEVAARHHIQNIIPVLEQTLDQAKLTPNKLDRLAVTVGPGLITSLIVGIETAKTLSYVWKKPIVPVNHMKAHLYANWSHNQKINFPAITLIVSGGHTEIILQTSPTHLKKIGATIDDAAGEAFDKVAQLLGLGYPGGPAISKLAKTGSRNAYPFPRPMLKENNFNFSFSGLKTAVLYTTQKIKKITPAVTADIAASFEQAAVDILVEKTIRAAQTHHAKTIMLSGGVAANGLLRQTLATKAKNLKIKFLTPDIHLCTDNAAMIAIAAAFDKPSPWHTLKVNPNLDI
ncbi:MAG: tRNA (adenosine(37)-N6)-threonylcarbamoyltransferase complex transferase subunit TsaD [Candidatus Buchananbacteria bacterium]|nr:tRNA (adenosine(37)-N6)-threonylcarbamoyltransferase complex transferase subunit TsaD [Candidatus Buchananbacteria bacterium]